MLEVWLRKVKQFISENDHENRPQCFPYKGYEIYITAMWRTSGKKYYFMQVNKDGKEVCRGIGDDGYTRDTVEMLGRIWIDEHELLK